MSILIFPSSNVLELISFEKLSGQAGETDMQHVFWHLNLTNASEELDEKDCRLHLLHDNCHYFESCFHGFCYYTLFHSQVSELGSQIKSECAKIMSLYKEKLENKVRTVPYQMKEHLKIGNFCNFSKMWTFENTL